MGQNAKNLVTEIPRVEKLVLNGKFVEGDVLTASEVIPNCERQKHVWEHFKKEVKYQWLLFEILNPFLFPLGYMRAHIMFCIITGPVRLILVMLTCLNHFLHSGAAHTKFALRILDTFCIVNVLLLTCLIDHLHQSQLYQQL